MDGVRRFCTSAWACIQFPDKRQNPEAPDAKPAHQGRAQMFADPLREQPGLLAAEPRLPAWFSGLNDKFAHITISLLDISSHDAPDFNHMHDQLPYTHRHKVINRGLA